MFHKIDNGQPTNSERFDWSECNVPLIHYFSIFEGDSPLSDFNYPLICITCLSKFQIQIILNNNSGHVMSRPIVKENPREKFGNWLRICMCANMVRIVKEIPFVDIWQVKPHVSHVN